ncbi:hypothetical protein JN01_0271 [Entomoplasma freundtii]|uniref:Uncharacterized protein n=1 Tax=Entomoplasma freundtii TaxID=74700 RepID=A0A2K8NR39_9MOLU|nr:hypothetical protein [Entomoplasma freundtii]ATZ16315.1 hypothetical protein EFREU_v1c02890 [Entomoplasma freundtii]TDY56783.1 hypothetical protein JN01_0271 [Entomoplasma freundtii]
MNATWIVILSLFGFIILILGLKTLSTFFKKNEKSNAVVEIETKEDNHEDNFISLEAIINTNNHLQETENANIAQLNDYIRNRLLELINSPEYVFNLHLLEMNDYLNDLIENKLLTNSASIWNKKFNNEIIRLQFKNQELQKKNNDLGTLRLQKETEILDGWENVKKNH